MSESIETSEQAISLGPCTDARPFVSRLAEAVPKEQHPRRRARIEVARHEDPSPPREIGRAVEADVVAIEDGRARANLLGSDLLASGRGRIGMRRAGQSRAEKTTPSEVAEHLVSVLPDPLR